MKNTPSSTGFYKEKNQANKNSKQAKYRDDFLTSQWYKFKAAQRQNLEQLLENIQEQSPSKTKNSIKSSQTDTRQTKVTLFVGDTEIIGQSGDNKHAEIDALCRYLELLHSNHNFSSNKKLDKSISIKDSLDDLECETIYKKLKKNLKENQNAVYMSCLEKPCCAACSIILGLLDIPVSIGTNKSIKLTSIGQTQIPRQLAKILNKTEEVEKFLEQEDFSSTLTDKQKAIIHDSKKGLANDKKDKLCWDLIWGPLQNHDVNLEKEVDSDYLNQSIESESNSLDSSYETVESESTDKE